MRAIERTLLRLSTALLLVLVAIATAPQANAYEAELGVLVRKAQRAAVKIYGAGGGGLTAYQSGFLVSPQGHIATAWSHVLDVEPVVVLDDGRRFNAKIVGFEPQLELAVLKIEADELPFLELAKDAPELADPVLAVSNLFGIATGGEPASSASDVA
jgi:S1-C subfamily serine protease